MLLRVGSGSGHDRGGVNDGDEGKSRVAIDYGKEITRGTVLWESYDGTRSSNFIAAEVATGRIRKGSSICGTLAQDDAVGTVIVGRRASYYGGGHHGRGCVTACIHWSQVKYFNLRAAIPDKHEISIARNFQAVWTGKRVQVVGAGSTALTSHKSADVAIGSKAPGQ